MAGRQGTHTAANPHHAHHAPPHASTAPKVVLSFTPSGPEYAISEMAEMPSINVAATFDSVTVRPGVTLEFVWTARVDFHGHGCPHAMGRVTSHTPMHAKTSTGNWTIPFSQVRGGTLTVGVQDQVEHHQLSATKTGLSVLGANPTPTSLLCTSYPNETFRS